RTPSKLMPRLHESSPPRLREPVRVVVAASGAGRSLENLLTWQGKLAKFKVCGVISSNPSCRANDIARQHGLPLYQEPFGGGGTKPSPQLTAWLFQVKADWIALAGFLKIFPTDFQGDAPWRNHIINI